MDIHQRIRQQVSLRRFLLATAIAQSPGISLNRCLEVVRRVSAAHPDWPLDEERTWMEWSMWITDLEDNRL